MVKYNDRIRYTSELDLSLMNKTQSGRKKIKIAKSYLTSTGDIWLLKFWGAKINLKSLVDFLFSYNLDVFDVEYDSITKIYICNIDDYRIRNSVVYNVFGTKNEKC